MPPHQKKKSKSKPQPEIKHKPITKAAKPKPIPRLPFPDDDDVPDFPRGGASSLSREERDEVRAAATEEFAAEHRVLKKNYNKDKRKQGRNSSKSTEDEDGSLFGAGLAGKLPRYANRITLKNISAGMKLWGVIAEVNKKDIVVSLPGGLRGLVRAHEASDSILDEEAREDAEHFLSRVYHVGQLVSCIVLQIDDDKKEITKRKIWLSLRLSLLHKSLTLDVIQEGMVLSAYVRSIEDRGFLLQFGSKSFTGFMKHNQSENKTSEVIEGQLLQGVVKSVDRNRKEVHLSSDAGLISKSVIKEPKGISVDLLVPGMMVSTYVESTLENGVMLSFLTYFTGTVDIFNLDKLFPSSNWKDAYSKNMKFNARILFIDPSTRAVGLTMNPHLVNNKAPPSLVKAGEIFDQSKVVRIDKGSGLLLEVPTLPVPTPAYVYGADVSDKEVRKLEKSFKEGAYLRVRVLGFRNLEGLATGSLKTSAFEGIVFTHSDIKPGMVVKAKVVSVDSFGAIVQLASGLKALCPLRHMSEFEIAKPRKKFQVGAEMSFRVLGCKSKRITVTHKKTLLRSNLKILSLYTDATEGLVTHGWITKIESHGCFVHFYNGVHGFAPRSELGLDPGADISSTYHVEQVIKCRVVKCIPASHRINLSFNMTPTRTSGDENVKPGSLVSGVVEQIMPDTVVVNVNSSSRMKGTIALEHLSDHHGLAALLISCLRPGYQFDALLILDVEGNNLVLTAKHSLITLAQQLPGDIGQIHPHSVVHGYICNVIETGCFVRYIGRLTGFAPKSKAADDWSSDLSEIFYIGQSVRSNVVDISSAKGRITLSLKQSLSCSTDASFIREYFLLEEKIAELQLSDSEENGLSLNNAFGIGSIVEGKVHEIKEFGVVVSFENNSNVFGFISQYQLANVTIESGSVVRAAVLDVSKIDRLVDLSLKPNFINHRSKKEISSSQTPKKKRKREAHKDLEVNQVVNATVEIVKDNYLVLSIPAFDHTVGYASLTDYNTQKLPPLQFSHGQSVSATVVALPAPDTCGRLLLLLKSLTDGADTSSSKRAKKKSSYDVGSLVQAEIIEIKPIELRVKFGSGFHGRIHVTEATDGISTESPFSNYRIGQTVAARIVSNGSRPENVKGSHHRWELSIKPALLKGSFETIGSLSVEEFSYSIGQNVSGFVYKIDHDWAWVTISRDVNAQLYILDSSSEPSELADFQKRFYVGKALSGYTISVNKEKKLLRIVLRPPVVGTLELKENDTASPLMPHIAEKSLVGGRISKILPGVGGLLVQIDQHLYGRVHFTELKDSWVSNPLSDYHEGQFVKCKVIEVDRAVEGKVHVDLSLRLNDPCTMNSSNQQVDKITDLRPNMAVKGYVKNVSSKGCFIMLSRKIDAKILITNLSDDFLEKPELEFPIGKLVTGRVLAVEPLSKRVEVTLRTSNTSTVAKSDTNSLSSVVGDIISGRIKRVESFGLFISIDRTNVVGLCHISELSDEHTDDIESKYKAGDKVKAKVLKVDMERNRVSLGMKSSYFLDDDDVSETPDHTIGNDDSMSVLKPTVVPHSSSAWAKNTDDEFDHGSILAEVESRALVPPLEVSLDDMEILDVEDDAGQSVADATVADNTEGKRRTKKKAKEEREREIRAAEERLLEKDIPRNADEFEKLVRSSSDSSFIWIKYMAFMLSLAQIDKAREIAERALRTINIREESEKLNIWVAYFNLENEYGNPPEEAVSKIFQRALQYCDPKKAYIALLGMYERTEQQKMADELLHKMIKKFKHSAKVWLRKVQFLLKQNDEIQPVVTRALECLPKHKHIKFISQTAILEFKGGVPNRGRSMFEKVLREYPKRTDLWSIYLDQEIRVGDVDVIRALFERAISLSLPPKKIKFLFNKYLAYEKSTGDEERIEAVKRKAMEYVENTTS